MKTQKSLNTSKRDYQKPNITRLALDSEISMVMLSGEPPVDPLGSDKAEHFSLSPFKFSNR